jgi:hypothetical protein
MRESKMSIGPVGAAPGSDEWIEVGVLRDPDPVMYARMALCEVGRPDLAERVRTNRAGWPSIVHGEEDHEVIARAFCLAHIASGHLQAKLVRDLFGVRGINCPDCDVARA